MGIKGLHTYITDRNGFESISLTNLLHRTAADGSRRSRKIIVDGSSLTFFLLSCRINGQSIDVSHGGQFLQSVLSALDQTSRPGLTLTRGFFVVFFRPFLGFHSISSRFLPIFNKRASKLSFGSMASTKVRDRTVRPLVMANILIFSFFASLFIQIQFDHIANTALRGPLA